MISLTKEAAEQIRLAAEKSDAQGMGLRLAAKVNDAGMLEFGMGFDQERENDAVHESWGITLLVSKHSAPYLQDVTLDFAEIAPGQRSFVFMKPGSEEPSSGGCGSGGCGSASGGAGGCGSGGCS
jgi:iron-sulfur cluster assembly protein